MAVKFKRDGTQRFEWNIRGRSPQAVRKRTLYIYMGLIIAFSASLVVHMIGNGASRRMMSSTEGIALVTEKIVRTEGLPEPQYFLRCEVAVPFPVEEGKPKPNPASTTLSDLVMTDKASFDSVKEGSRITVNYRATANHTKLRIHRMVLDKLMAPIEESSIPRRSLTYCGVFPRSSNMVEVS